VDDAQHVRLIFSAKENAFGVPREKFFEGARRRLIRQEFLGFLERTMAPRQPQRMTRVRFATGISALALRARARHAHAQLLHS
jgi:hypothetical protein